jgi:hypothetical protein
MPNIRRYPAPLRNTGPELGKWHKFALMFCAWDLLGAFDDEEAAREAYETHREAYLEEHAAEHPGTRPGCWWRWEAPEPRRVVNRPSHPELARQLEADGPDGQKRGGRVLLGYTAPDGSHGFGPWLEEEADYLERLDLFLPGERERLEDLDGPPPAGTIYTDSPEED